MDANSDVTYGSYRIKLKSERLRETEKGQGGWKPRAEIWIDSGDSLIVQPIGPKQILRLATKEEADKIAMETAELWIQRNVKNPSSDSEVERGVVENVRPAKDKPQPPKPIQPPQPKK